MSVCVLLRFARAKLFRLILRIRCPFVFCSFLAYVEVPIKGTGLRESAVARAGQFVARAAHQRNSPPLQPLAQPHRQRVRRGKGPAALGRQPERARPGLGAYALPELLAGRDEAHQLRQPVQAERAARRLEREPVGRLESDADQGRQAQGRVGRRQKGRTLKEIANYQSIGSLAALAK